MKSPATVLAIAVLAAAACAPTPKRESDVVVGPGPRPSPELAERVIVDFLKGQLKDPDSLKQFRMTGGPATATWYQGLMMGNRYESGWLYCFEYNAKNSYGGYVGVKPERIVLRGGLANDTAFVVPNVNWGLLVGSC